MKFIAVRCTKDRGPGIGILIAALTAGSALRPLFNALPVYGGQEMADRTTMIVVSSIAATIGGNFLAEIENRVL